MSEYNTILTMNVPNRDGLTTKAFVLDENMKAGNTLTITENSYDINLKEYFGDDYSFDGWGVNYYLIVYQEDSNSDVKYINKFTYNGIGELDEESILYLMPNDDFILLPILPKPQHIYMKLVLEDLLDYLKYQKKD